MAGQLAKRVQSCSNSAERSKVLYRLGDIAQVIEIGEKVYGIGGPRCPSCVLSEVCAKRISYGDTVRGV